MRSSWAPSARAALLRMLPPLTLFLVISISMPPVWLPSTETTSEAGGKDGAKPCSTIDTVDLKNAELELEMRGRLKFVDGRVCSDPGFLIPCDWENTITMDRLLTPEPGVHLRMCVVYSNHVGGSGAWDDVLILRCDGGMLTKLFERNYLYGAKIGIINDHEFVITSGRWRANDAMCCPSQEKEEIFRWNTVARQYDLVRTQVREIE